MRTYFLTTLMLAMLSGTAFAAETKVDCPEALDFFGTMNLTKTYEGYQTADDERLLDDAEEPAAVLATGKYQYHGTLDFVSLKKNRCTYETTNLTLTQKDNKTKFIVRTFNKKPIKGWMQYHPNGEFAQVQVGPFRVDIKKKAKLDKVDKKVTTTFEGYRDLWISTFYKGQDDTQYKFGGRVIYFDFGDGHEQFGTATLTLQQD